MTEALNVFYSYARQDEALRDELASHLTILERRGIIQSWHNRQISAGEERASRIHDKLNAADIILLLVSPAFLASDDCWDVELKRAIARHETGKAQVIPIILRPVDWSDAPFAELQPLPWDAKPITTWANRDQAFLDVAKQLRKVIESEQKRRAARPASPATPAATPPQAPAQPAATPAGPPAAAPQPRLDCRTLRDHGLLDALASVFDTEAAATGILEQAGVPRSRLLPFGQLTPIQYWQSVCRELEKGLVAGGLAALLREAAGAYPYNPAFQHGLRLASGTPATSPSGGVATGGVATGGTPPGGTPSGGAATGEDPLAIWRERLTHLLREEAIVSDAGQKFTLSKQIEEARARIRELGG